MSMSKEDFLKFLAADEFKRGNLPATQELYFARMWEAYQWGIQHGKDEAIDGIAAFLKRSINGPEQ